MLRFHRLTAISMIFLLIFANIAYAGYHDDDDDLVDNSQDKCPATTEQISLVDSQFGCSCAQLTSSDCSSRYSGASCCPSDGNECTDDCMIVETGIAKTARCTPYNKPNGAPCNDGTCQNGQCRRFQTTADASGAITQRTLVILARANGQPLDLDNAQARRLIFDDPSNSLSGLFNANSFGSLVIGGDVYGPYDISLPENCQMSDVMRSGIGAARSNNVNTGGYDRKIVITSVKCRSGGHGKFCGGGTLRGSEAFGVANSNVECRDIVATLAQELGHNLDLDHAGICNDPPICTDSINEDVGDLANPMNSGKSHFNSQQKEWLGWLRPQNIRTIRGGEGGTFTIEPIEIASNGIQLLKIERPNARGYYTLTFRQPINYDATLAPGVYIHVAGAWRRATKALNFQNRNEDASRNLFTIMTPALQVGTPYIDELNDIKITLQRLGPNGAEVYISRASETPPPAGAPPPSNPPRQNPPDACEGVVCISPANYCDGNNAVIYNSNGECDSGNCIYPQTTFECPNGCSNGECIEGGDGGSGDEGEGKIDTSPSTYTGQNVGKIGNGNGLNAVYQEKSIGTQTGIVVPNINFPELRKSIGAGNKDMYATWDGVIQPKVTSNHTFYINYCGGARITIDGGTIVNDWGKKVPKIKVNNKNGVGMKDLSNEVIYSIKVEIVAPGEKKGFFGIGASGGCDGGTVLEWSANGLAREVVPQSQLYTYQP